MLRLPVLLALLLRALTSRPLRAADEKTTPGLNPTRYLVHAHLLGRRLASGSNRKVIVQQTT
jgi:hypothetical protein